MPGEESTSKTESRNPEDVYRAVFENTGTGTIIIDYDMTILHANATFAAMTGYSREQLENRMKWSQFVVPEDRDRMQNYHYGRREPGNTIPTEYECRVVVKGNQLKYMYMKVGMIPDSKKSIASFMDITERKRAEDRLRESESTLSTIVETFVGYIYISTADKRLEFMNRTLIEQRGENVLEKPCYTAVFGLDKPCPWCSDDQAFEGNTVRREMQNPLDARWYLSVRTPIFNPEGRVVKVQSILMDITDRKLTEEAIAESAQHLKDENIRLRSEIKDRYKFGDIVGKSPVMQEVYELILKAAATNAHVMIHGESGTGKELVARAIHRTSERKDHPFVAVNCGAISENLSESEFFGYKKGAFTGANTDKPGFLDAADNGTLFLDEIGEISLAMQVKLLRAIEGSGYTPVGGILVRKPNIRIVAATNRNLKELVRTGMMREDFYYRIHIIPIKLPPLRERKEDLPLLIDHFLDMFAGKKEPPPVTGNMIETFNRYHWPGNVRELQNVLNRYVTLRTLDFMDHGETGKISVETRDGEPDGLLENLTGQVEAFEKKVIQAALERNRWQKIKAAESLGIHRKTLFVKMKKYEIK
jgi:PAS domain S-box-containing protein